MITFFTTAKAFQGHSAIIQRNALRSWKYVHPDVEIILFGDEEGVADVSTELGLRYEPHVDRHESGMKYLNYMFKRAQEIACHDILCYSNCDIIQLPEFGRAAELVAASKKRFLLVGQRWDADVTQPVDFSAPDWTSTLRHFARTTGLLQLPHYIDYFVFRRGLFDEVPPLVIGRSYWDHWLVWKALSQGAAVVDCTPFATAIHQNHGHGYHPKGKQGTNEDELARKNIELAGHGRHLRYTLDSTHKLHANGKIRRTFLRRQYFEWKIEYKIQKIINITYPLRRLLGLRRRNFDRIPKTF